MLLSLPLFTLSSFLPNEQCFFYSFKIRKTVRAKLYGSWIKGNSFSSSQLVEGSLHSSSWGHYIVNPSLAAHYQVYEVVITCNQRAGKVPKIRWHFVHLGHVDVDAYRHVLKKLDIFKLNGVCENIFPVIISL